MLRRNYLHRLKRLPIEDRLRMLIGNMISLRTNDMGFHRILLFLFRVGVGGFDLFGFRIGRGFGLFGVFAFGSLLLTFFFFGFFVPGLVK